MVENLRAGEKKILILSCREDKNILQILRYEKCTIVFKNAAGTEYEAVIDLSGNFITAPYAK